MKTWQFTTEAFPESERQSAWLSAMDRLCLPLGNLPKTDNFRGSVSCIISPLGLEFARVDADPQEISGQYPPQEEAIWLTLLLEGEAMLIHEENSIKLIPGDIIYGPTAVGATLKFTSRFRQIFIKLPRLAINPRLISPLSLTLGHLLGQSGINHVLSGMLRALADGLDDINDAQLRPVELALTELLLTCIAEQKGILSIGNAANTRADNLHRICQTIETLLGDPDLAPAQVAEAHGVSLRYMQKLFTLADKTFSNYVRTRRLERCRADLVSPLYSQISITEICFRWGFNSSAYFSRSFRDLYGISPRDFRRQNTPQDQDETA
ncbi:helix-turn-helix domain-containing protein [Paremcibacter congregatus]|uniref:helix-turn-helix domain-containing protein n=1 Tax=Paremcibacter congregatus TaxID=2043170 RepID=UPI0030EF8926|tara:strand:+ start:4721 stop:5689 length:969 start_codon:yes stop_codon:yes gene_type:complete